VLDRASLTLELRVAGRSRDYDGLNVGPPFVVGHSATSGLVLAAVDAEHASVVQISESICVPVAASLDVAQALALPALAAALSIWESLHLALGEAAVFTSGGALSTLAGQVALWRGGCPVVELGPAGAGATPDIMRIDWTDPEKAARQLIEATDNRPGFAAVEFSGRAEILDVLLEMMPRWSRLLLAGPAGEPVTIDFYRNVHRKGAVIAALDVDAGSIFDLARGAAVRAQIPAATQTLLNARMAHTCLSLLGLQATSAAR
jgi:NADPH:quinone reductase-like Zn-dependent oxidoreductase